MNLPRITVQRSRAMRRLLVFGMLALIPAGAQAQVAPGATPAPLITQKTCVDSTHRLLGPLAGEYRVRTLFRAGPTTWDSTDAHAQFAWELGGCLMVEHFFGRRYGEPYSTIALWGTSGNPDHAIQRVFAHSQHGLLGLSEGRWNASGDTLVLADSAFVRGGWIQERYIVTRPRDRAFTTEGRRSEDQGTTWIVTQRSRYTRL
ncbi:MAG TPA: hypothetical protein VHE78_02930 [Gemmatimonadaceae bacterium]|nr:hypothetical protein [Gemmatimonadaceae bacterium]